MSESTWGDDYSLKSTRIYAVSPVHILFSTMVVTYSPSHFVFWGPEEKYRAKPEKSVLLSSYPVFVSVKTVIKLKLSSPNPLTDLAILCLCLSFWLLDPVNGGALCVHQQFPMGMSLPSLFFKCLSTCPLYWAC